MHFLFLTSNNLATNPRCVKEIHLALELGYKVSVLAFRFDNWSKPQDDRIRESLPQVTFYDVDAIPSSKFKWIAYGLAERSARVLTASRMRFGKAMSALAVNKRNMQSLSALRHLDEHFDLIIAHNPGVFYAAMDYAGRKNIPFAIDVEDYHPGETDDKTIRQQVIALMNMVLPSASYVSFASPLIKDATEAKLKDKLKHAFVVNNVFNENEFASPLPRSGKPSFVWFSQHIGFDRGLELLLPVLDSFKEEICLTLIGNPDADFFEKWLKNRSWITLEPPMDMHALHSKMQDFDIGLAIEPGRDENNRVAISNKIWTYMQAGLYVFASDTDAQLELLKRKSDYGVAVHIQDMAGTKATIKKLIQNIHSLRDHAVTRWKNMQAEGWQSEKLKLVDVWQQITNAK